MAIERASLTTTSEQRPLLWVQRTPGAPYFQTEDGAAWHPIGQNDAVSWDELGSLYRRRDVARVVQHLQYLRAHGVTVLRLMLEYAQVRGRFFETRAGHWSKGMVDYWDDLLALCEQCGMRVLITPFDTFWMWIRFKHHPYNQRLGGPLEHPSRALLDPATREAIKARLRFAAERWGGSGAIFAWDLWNEIHPAQAEMSAAPFVEFIQDLSATVREVETRVHGRTHLQTVSLFGPELKDRPEMAMEAAIFRHPALDFATIHIYEHGSIDDPADTVKAAVSMGRLVRGAIGEIDDGRPFLDTEHGPIHAFKDKRVTLPEAFDDEYFRHMQWAHLASGGAGGGMRWPNRSPHALTHGMRMAQLAMSKVLPALDWLRFDRSNINDEITVRVDGRIATRKIARFGCASADQAMVYLLRRDALLPDGRLQRESPGLRVTVEIPGLVQGAARVSVWDTVTGYLLCESVQQLANGRAVDLPELQGDYAVVVQFLQP